MFTHILTALQTNYLPLLQGAHIKYSLIYFLYFSPQICPVFLFFKCNLKLDLNSGQFKVEKKSLNLKKNGQHNGAVIITVVSQRDCPGFKSTDWLSPFFVEFAYSPHVYVFTPASTVRSLY